MYFFSYFQNYFNFFYLEENHIVLPLDVENIFPKKLQDTTSARNYLIIFSLKIFRQTLVDAAAFFFLWNIHPDDNRSDGIELIDVCHLIFIKIIGEPAPTNIQQKTAPKLVRLLSLFGIVLQDCAYDKAC